MLRIGDKIKCIDPVGSIRKNGVYTISGFSQDDSRILYIEEDTGGYYKSRFVLVGRTNNFLPSRGFKYDIPN
jgi:hypothetical protein